MPQLSEIEGEILRVGVRDDDSVAGEVRLSAGTAWCDGSPLSLLSLSLPCPQSQTLIVTNYSEFSMIFLPGNKKKMVDNYERIMRGLS